MSDFDAVRIGIENAFNSAGYQALCAAQQISDEQTRPSVLFRPNLARDGNRWSVLYGDNIAIGVCGFGDSPEEAMRDFDKAWHTKLPVELRRFHDDGRFIVPVPRCP